MQSILSVFQAKKIEKLEERKGSCSPINSRALAFMASTDSCFPNECRHCSLPLIYPSHQLMLLVTEEHAVTTRTFADGETEAQGSLSLPRPSTEHGRDWVESG